MKPRDYAIRGPLARLVLLCTLLIAALPAGSWLSMSAHQSEAAPAALLRATATPVPIIRATLPGLVVRPLLTATPTETASATATPTAARRIVRPEATSTQTITASPTSGRLIVRVQATATQTATARIVRTAIVLPNRTPTPSRTRTQTSSPTPTRTRFQSTWLTPHAHIATTSTYGLTLVPSTAAVGQIVTFFAKGYNPPKKVYSPAGNYTQIDTVDIRFAGVPGTCGSQNKVFTTATPDTNGWIQGTFVVPGISCYSVTTGTVSGSKNAGASLLVQAVGSKSGHLAAGTLKVPATAISVAVQQDGTVQLQGAGYASGEYVFLQYQYGGGQSAAMREDAGVGHADQTGRFTASVPAGYGLPGGYGILGTGVTSSFNANVSVAQ